MKTVIEKIMTGLQYILPHHLLSRLVYVVMHCEFAGVKNLLIRVISHLAGINNDEALSSDLAHYASFNAWFTRELKPDARVFSKAPAALLCPCDGTISETGGLHHGRILQAKGKDYSLRDLLADDPVCDQLSDGFFATIYLAPRDYHRVHMPHDGVVQRMLHVPGRLFSVAPYTVRQVPHLFSRNERVICVFSTDSGPMVMVLVGAMLVASMETVWAGEITPNKRKNISVTDYSGRDIALAKGAEMGRFNMGSTVILLLPKASLQTPPSLTTGSRVKVGQRLAMLRDDGARGPG